MRKTTRHVLAYHVLILGLTAMSHLGALLAETPLSPAKDRVGELVGILPAAPAGLGRPITDRDAWRRIGTAPDAALAVAAAEKLLGTPVPELTDDLYLDFSRTGNRTRCQRVLVARRTRIPRFALAECLENRGRFLPALEESIRAICAAKTWVLPAHDRGLRNFHGQLVDIDLAVAGLSWELATAYYWLGDKLSPETRELIRSELRRRTFGPFKSCVSTGKPSMWWVTCTNNWNAVCLAGTVGAALAVIDSREERAFFVAGAEKSIPHFLSGFTADGYCSEGTGYWNYGFGHYVLLAETLRQATDGELDWMATPKVAAIAHYGRRIEIWDGVYPAFADCSVNSRPSSSLMAYLSRIYGMGMEDVERRGVGLAGGLPSTLVGLGVYGFPNAASHHALASSTPLARRDYFERAGILLCRPGPGSHAELAVALKGGHNGEHHNHNDVGSYLVALRGGAPLIDPGAEVYTARTFSSKRYESDVLNSFGHPVPRVAGKLQRPGREAAAKVLRTEFTDASDTVVLDLRSAYGVRELEQLERTFVYSRTGAGSLTVTDEVRFSEPRMFETALVTLGRWSRPAPDRLVFGEGKQAVEVTVDAGDAALNVEPASLTADVRTREKPARIGLAFAQPVARARITLTIRPAQAPDPKVRFVKTQLDDTYRSEGVAVADFNADGQLDGAAGGVYFAAPDCQMVPIAAEPTTFDVKRYGDSFLCFADDLNGDSRPDLLVVGFPGRTTHWYENPGERGGPWPKHLAIKNTNNESPYWTDVDGDGRVEMVCGSPRMALVRPRQENPREPWAVETIAGSNDPKIRGTLHGLGVGDINGDNRNDILIVKGWWEAPRDPNEKPWRFHPADFGGRAGQMPIYDFDGDGDNDVLTTSAHDYGVWWLEQTPEGWRTHPIDDSYSQTHSVCLADVDGDGLKDFVTGKRYYAHCGRDPGCEEPAVICWYRLTRKDGTASWTKHVIDEDSGAGLNFEVTDVDADGLPDIVVANKKGVFYFRQIRE